MSLFANFLRIKDVMFQVAKNKYYFRNTLKFFMPFKTKYVHIIKLW